MLDDIKSITTSCSVPWKLQLQRARQTFYHRDDSAREAAREVFNGKLVDQRKPRFMTEGKSLVGGSVEVYPAVW